MIFDMSEKKLRFPKYNFGLLQTPDSSDVNSTLLSNTGNPEINKTLATTPIEDSNLATGSKSHANGKLNIYKFLYYVFSFFMCCYLKKPDLFKKSP